MQSSLINLVGPFLAKQSAVIWALYDQNGSILSIPIISAICVYLMIRTSVAIKQLVKHIAQISDMRIHAMHTPH